MKIEATLGLRPFPLPMGVKLPQDYSEVEMHPVVSWKTLMDFLILTDCKSGCTNNSLEYQHLRTGQCYEMLTYAYAERLETDESRQKEVNKVV